MTPPRLVYGAVVQDDATMPTTAATAGGRRRERMRIGILGAGAIGSIVGGLLTKAGHDVTLIDQWPDHVEAMKRVGLRLSGSCGEHVIAVKALHLHEAQAVDEPFSAVFLAMKSYRSEE